MSIDLSQFRDMFFEEAEDHLDAFERSVLSLEAVPDDLAAVREMFRAAHSLKGSSSTIGLTDVAAFTHELESVLDPMREGTLAADKGLIDVLLRSNDALRALLAAARSDTAPPEDIDTLAAQLRGHYATDARQTTARPLAASPTDESSGQLRVSVRPARSLLVAGLDPLPLLRELGEVVRVTMTELDTDALPDLADLEPEVCYLGWRLQVDPEGVPDAEVEIREVFEFVEDTCDVLIEQASAPVASPDARAAAAAPSPGEPSSAPRAEASSLRVPTERVDEIIDLVGELIISHGALHELSRSRQDGDLAEAVAGLGRALADLQRCALSVRTMPLMTVFCRFPRLVRDLAQDLGKVVQLRVQGGETELDKSIIECLASPMTHIIRNAVDHGIETASERQRTGKDATGTVEICARQGQGTVVIEIRDDGRGLDRERILERGMARGLVAANEALSDARVYELIFEPGFSTATNVSDVSGRGVGMDAARDAIEALNGTLEIDSKPGAGTCTRITLPLTLAVLDGFAVTVANQSWVVPMSSVVEIVKPRVEDCTSLLNRGWLIELRGEAIPLISLAEVLGLGAAPEPYESLVVVAEVLDQRIALLVDAVQGELNVVIKPLDEAMREHPALLGATVLGNGDISFILDLAGIIREHRARRESQGIAYAEGGSA